MLRILTVDVVFDSTKYRGEDKDSMMKDVSVRNMASCNKITVQIRS